MHQTRVQSVEAHLVLVCSATALRTSLISLGSLSIRAATNANTGKEKQAES
jgi:hypothetical protein